MRRTLFAILLLCQLAVLAVLAVPALAVVRGRALAVLLPALLLAVAAALAVAAILAPRLARPVKDLTAAFRRVGAGDFSARVRPGRRGELKELGDSFNEMAERTRNLVADLTREQAALNAVIGSISEGLVVLDRDGRVVLANDSFARIAGTTDHRNRYYWEVIREPRFAQLLRDTGSEQPALTTEVELSGRSYVCSASRIEPTGETVVTMHDVTEISNAARVKRDLVLNVSHELRTPLTAIRGFAETLEETAAPAERRYLDIIRRHTDRLMSLIQDLLTLSELEEPGARLILEEVDVPALAAGVVGMFRPAAESRGLTVSLNGPASLPPVRLDRVRIEQALINLIDNAVKYSDRGGVTVTISREADATRIVVEDTGPGMAAEHLPRLFERFYVVDKSRSRQVGGTGLGLAIVKHIVMLHGGEVSVHSTPGVGTRFSVLLPDR